MVIDEEVSVVFHKSDPTAAVDKVDPPQLSRTVTTGAAGVVFGEAVMLPGILVQPAIVVVTV